MRQVPSEREINIIAINVPFLGRGCAPITGHLQHFDTTLIAHRLGCGFPVSFEFPPMPSKPSSVCLATEFA